MTIQLELYYWPHGNMGQGHVAARVFDPINEKKSMYISWDLGNNFKEDCQRYNDAFPEIIQLPKNDTVTFDEFLAQYHDSAFSSEPDKKKKYSLTTHNCAHCVKRMTTLAGYRLDFKKIQIRPINIASQFKKQNKAIVLRDATKREALIEELTAIDEAFQHLLSGAMQDATCSYENEESLKKAIDTLKASMMTLQDLVIRRLTIENSDPPLFHHDEHNMLEEIREEFNRAIGAEPANQSPENVNKALVKTLQRLDLDKVTRDQVVAMFKFNQAIMHLDESLAQLEKGKPQVNFYDVLGKEEGEYNNRLNEELERIKNQDNDLYLAIDGFQRELKCREAGSEIRKQIDSDIADLVMAVDAHYQANNDKRSDYAIRKVEVALVTLRRHLDNDKLGVQLKTDLDLTTITDIVPLMRFRQYDSDLYGGFFALQKGIDREFSEDDSARANFTEQLKNVMLGFADIYTRPSKSPRECERIDHNAQESAYEFIEHLKKAVDEKIQAEEAEADKNQVFYLERANHVSTPCAKLTEQLQSMATRFGETVVEDTLDQYKNPKILPLLSAQLRDHDMPLQTLLFQSYIKHKGCAHVFMHSLRDGVRAIIDRHNDENEIAGSGMEKLHEIYHALKLAGIEMPDSVKDIESFCVEIKNKPEHIIQLMDSMHTNYLGLYNMRIYNPELFEGLWLLRKEIQALNAKKDTHKIDKTVENLQAILLKMIDELAPIYKNLRGVVGEEHLIASKDVSQRVKSTLRLINNAKWYAGFRTTASPWYVKLLRGIKNLILSPYRKLKTGQASPLLISTGARAHLHVLEKALKKSSPSVPNPLVPLRKKH